MQQQHPFFVSIITVNLNNAEGLKFTMESIVNQDYKNIEVIVVDGGSTDESFSILDSYKGIVTKKIVGEDSGIYDAMNIGLSHISSRSDFVIFLNSGDGFAGPNTISAVMKHARPLENFYGNVVKGSLISYKNKAMSLRGLASHMICHQAIFFSSPLHRELLYNTQYSLAADYDLLIRAVKKKWKFNYLDVPISILQTGGVSSTNRIRLFEQKKAIRTNHKELMFWYYLHKIKTITK